MKKSKAIKINGQQGDVLFLRRLPSIPSGKRISISKKRCVVAHGEGGHSHVVEDDEAELIQIGERMLLILGRDATVVHDEHKPIQLSAGVWEIGRVREHDYLNDMVRPVID